MVNQTVYQTPQDAVQAVVAAIKADDTNQLVQILGPDAKAVLNSGDPVADKQGREEFLQKYNQMHRFVTERNGSVTLYLGAENWPFPIPIVKKNGSWIFDTPAGEKEILYRRIGRNE